MLTLSRAAGFSVQAVQLAKRELLGLWRNKPGFVATYLVPTLLNLFFALIFFQVGDTTKSNYEINSHFGGVTQIAILVRVRIRVGIRVRANPNPNPNQAA